MIEVTLCGLFWCFLVVKAIIWLLFDCLYWGVTKVLEVILITKVNIIIYELRVTLKYSVILCYFV